MLRQRSKRGAERPAEAAAGGAGRRDLRPLRMLKPYILAHPGILVIAGLMLVLSALAMLSMPLALRRMIDFGFSESNNGFIDRYFGMLIVIGLVLAVASAGRFYFVNWLGERVVASVRANVFAHLATLGPSFYDQTRSGEVMSRLTADTTQMKAAASTALSQAARNIIMLVGALAMMFVTSAKLSLLVLGIIPAIVLPLMAYGRVVRRLSRHAQDTLADASAYAAENLSAVRTMQAFGQERAVAGLFGAAIERSFRAALVRLRARAGLTALVIFIVFSSIVGVLWYGAGLVVAGEISGGRLAQFVLYALFAGGALAELSEVWGEVSQAAGATERLAELLNTRSEIVSPAIPQPLPEPAKGQIEFRRVTFVYPSRPATKALDDVSFSISPGETVAIVGPSGAGKSTLFGLLLRFYDPNEGDVLLDGVSVASADLDALRCRIALVPQDVAIFAASVADNIRYGASGATLDDVRRAAQAAHADAFITALPDGYDTQLGERGVMLSGGQRQRIAIARAVLRDAPVLLLDEATSALDAESEMAVQKALERLMVGRTTLVVAHRLATVQRADRILVLDEGRLVEEGTHAALVRKSGLYARFAELQFGREAAE